MTEEQRAELMRKARNCRDNARAETVVSDAFMGEYREGLSPAPAEKHARSMELYDFAIKSQHRARTFLEDAELYEAAALSASDQTKEKQRHES